MAVLRACVRCGKPGPESYCSDHKPAPWQGSNRRELMGMSGWEWTELRQQALSRDLSTCYLCGKKDANEVDHLLPVAAGGENTLANLASAHSACHRRRHLDRDWAAPRIQETLELLRRQR